MLLKENCFVGVEAFKDGEGEEEEEEEGGGT